jgi:predicted adenine nucleotide alpha hydrolase (AANH) superfamily ATPase
MRMERILVHMCCGPCSIYPVKEVLLGKLEVCGFFCNPNVHPYEEYRKRLLAVRTLASTMDIEVLYEDRYMPEDFFKKMLKIDSTPPPHGERCGHCYTLRLEKTAQAAKDYGFHCFTTTLLYSKYQDHEFIKDAGFKVARLYGVPFYYEDFRGGWGRGIKLSKKMGLYRQNYCGCVYSKAERDQ